MSEHRTRLDIAAATKRDETTLYRAVCTCRWRGDWLEVCDLAERQADAHVDAC